LTRFAFPEMP